MAGEGKWSWWVGHSEERYDTECDSRREAVQIAREDYDDAYICEAKQYPPLKLGDQFDASDFIENANDNAWDQYADEEGDEPTFECSAEQERDLEKSVRDAIDAWQKRHNLRFRSFKFAASRNHEFIAAEELTE